MLVVHGLASSKSYRTGLRLRAALVKKTARCVRIEAVMDRISITEFIEEFTSALKHVNFLIC